MPALPAFLADRLLPIVARPTRVVDVEVLAPELRRVRFAGESLRWRAWRAGDQVEFRVGATALRHYTPSRFDGSRGRCEVLFYLHGHGPGSRWAADLATGASAPMLGPGSAFGLDRSARHHVLLGDETCLGLFSALAAALPAGARLTGAVELDEAHLDWPARLALPLDAVARTGRGAALCTWLDGQRAAPDTRYYLAGHAGSIVRLRSELSRRGVHRRAIRARPYWADGKVGL